jgi:hypothetical protein
VPIRQLLYLALVFLILLTALSLQPNISLASAPVQELDILQTGKGPVVNGLFGRFGPPPSVHCGVTLHCPAGSHAGLVQCCNECSKEMVDNSCNNYQCTNASYCVGSIKPTCCAAGCIQDYPPSCANCQRTGYCSQ